MKTFKFFKNNIDNQRVNSYNTENSSTITFAGGKFITSIRQDLSRHSNIWCGDFNPVAFFWEDRCSTNLYQNHTEGHSTYEGTIGRFIETYRYRIRINPMSNQIIPYNPVLVEIRYGFSHFINDDVMFSHEDMWVQIIYKVFYENI